MRRSIEDGLSMLAGAGIGVALMYLFDPDKGPQRRHRIAESSRDMLDSASERAGETLGRVSEKARAALSGGAAAVQSSDWAEHATSAARGLADRATDALSNVSDRLTSRASDAADEATARKRRWVNRASLAVGRDEDHHYVSQTACALGSLALGAGLVWLFDPRQGRSRRAWLRDKSMKSVRETGEFFRRTGRYVTDRLRGTVAETRGYLADSGEEDDEKLSARVRSELGRIVPNMSDVTVTAEGGCVIIQGQVDAPEIESIGNFVLGIRGVRGMENQLSPRGQGNPIPTSM